MVFTSFAFLFLFLPVFLAGYFALGKRHRNLWLFLASVAFYGWGRPYWVLIMLSSTVLDFTVALCMGEKCPGGNEEARPHRKLLLVLSIVANLGLLGWFKYANFFVHSTEAVIGTTFGWEDVLLPVGISFYTFQSMSYTIDVYRGSVRPTTSLVDFACYVTMFPQLVAGPIVRYRDVHQQLQHREHNLTQFGAGAAAFAIGFVKKVLIADMMAPIAAAGFGMQDPGLVPAWTSLLAYSVQIYFDFSGYSDMAIGLGLMLGFHFPRNFDSPYLSESITEAWRRWHISLSTWLRDYLYIPLGGNRLGELRTYANLMATMLIGGLWHGANWPFVCWGAYQGIWLCLERVRGRTAFHARLPRPLRIALTYLIFTFGWSMFVARDFAHLWNLWGGLFGVHGGGSALSVNGNELATYVPLLGALGIVFWMPNSAALLRRFHPVVIALSGVLFLAALSHSLAVTNLPFLYFRF
jgi:alginate O-acetyltransferase complex protein AlgI